MATWRKVKTVRSGAGPYLEPVELGDASVGIAGEEELLRRDGERQSLVRALEVAEAKGNLVAAEWARRRPAALLNVAGTSK